MNPILSEIDLKNTGVIDFIFVLGKPPGWEQKPDIILDNRLKLAFELFKLNPNSKIVCSGGKSYANKEMFDGSEAMVMRDYLEKNGVNPKNILVEEKSISGINQLILIKKDFVLKYKPEAIALVSDEFHMPAIAGIFDAINGDACITYYFGNKINISGKYRELIQNYFDERIKNQSELISLYKRGDHESFEKHEVGYRELMIIRISRGESRLQMIDPQIVLEFIKTGVDPTLVA